MRSHGAESVPRATHQQNSAQIAMNGWRIADAIRRM